MEHIMELTGLSETALAEITGYYMGVVISGVLAGEVILWMYRTFIEILKAAAGWLIHTVRKHIRKHR